MKWKLPPHEGKSITERKKQSKNNENKPRKKGTIIKIRK
jgi:hypothetical protein